ncbi:Uncharacterized protein BM_BM17684 [Brugia malayi]|uniref:C2H2-type domain-containing protein n=1 Tax=Brugia malayi TaxID=6279 RepID=A0A4E9FRI9_BRUMA|nr:Uncharacterized protein BM_BM17684 [Brugia malayi]VIO97220.1 Uncharacterized protein BM_BM17684 [Brugia malayi]
MASMEDIKIVFEYLKREPEMYRILQRFVSETLQFERSLIEGMMEAGRRLEGLVGQNAHEVMEENPVPQEPEFDEEEAERTPLPESSEEAENWPCEAEWTPLPYDEEEEENEPEAPVAPMETSGIDARGRFASRFLPRRKKWLRQYRKNPADLGDLPNGVASAAGGTIHVCGFCGRQFDTLKGWRIHASRMHRQEGFCARCGHNLLLPPGFTAAQRTAAVELHALDWWVPEGLCGRNWRKTGEAQIGSCGKRRGSFVHSRPIITTGFSHAANLSLPAPSLQSLPRNTAS